MSQEEEIKWRCRYAPSLGNLEDTTSNIWGTKLYSPNSPDTQDPTVFFGLYGLPDFYTLWRHKGPRAVLWAGTDILHFINGYWLDDKGTIKLSPKPLATWINKNCENYVENHVEYEALKKAGINSKIVPSFLGKVEDFPITFTPNSFPKLYTSVSGNNFEVYGWHRIYKIAEDNPYIEFHLYGNTENFPWPAGKEYPNVFFHGRVSKEQMNEEIKEMQGALRLTEFDGFSEIIAKSLLMGQHPVSLIPYPHTIALKDIADIRTKEKANIEGREWLLSVVNKYPWNSQS